MQSLVIVHEIPQADADQYLSVARSATLRVSPLTLVAYLERLLYDSEKRLSVR